ncbi:unnamed protein product [Caenorhabditis brenneri]
MATFPLLTLPYFPLKEVVKTMNLLEQNKLSLATPQTEALIKFMNIKVDYVSIWISQRVCKLHIHNIKSPRSPIPTFYKCKKDVEPPYISEYVTPEEPHVVDDPLEACIKMANRFYEIFNLKHQMIFITQYNHEDPDGMKRLISRLLSEECYAIEIIEVDWVKELDGTVLKHLMDTLKLETHVYIGGLIPDDFRHEKAFKFRSMIYEQAKWITMDDIKSIRNAKKFSCTYTNFNSKDLNDFLHYWISCDEEMMEECEIGVGGNFNFDEIFDGMSAVKIQGELWGKNSSGSLKVDWPTKLIKIRNPSNRKFTIAQVMLKRSKQIELKGLEPCEKYKLQLEILDEMEKEANLKLEFKEMDGGDLQKQLAEVQKGLSQLNFENEELLRLEKLSSFNGY